MIRYKHLLAIGIMTAFSLAFQSAALGGNTPQTQAFLDSLPERWSYSPEYSLPDPSSDPWWKNFNDPTLDALIARAEKNNFNAAMSLKRIEIARRQLQETKSSYFPTVNASAGWNINSNAGAIADPVMKSSSSSYFSMGLDMNWEIDVFGRITAQTKANKAAVAVSKADYDAIIVSLCANVADSYLQLRTYQNQYRVASEHIASQEKVLKIAEARFDAGIGDMLEVTQAKIVLLSTQSSIPGLESGIRTTANALAVLIGEYPESLQPDIMNPEPLPQNPGMPDIGFPADILRRRPDIAAAEMQLAQYAALAGVAKKDFLPTLSISGSVGTSAHRADNLFGAHSLAYSVAPTLSWTMFDGLARNQRLAEAKLQMEQSVDNYNMTLLNAVEEVENAISRYSAKIKECRMLEALMDESEKSLKLSLDLYKQGLTDFSNVADAQMSYLQNENQLVESKADVLTSLVSLYKALGGGWNSSGQTS